MGDRDPVTRERGLPLHIPLVDLPDDLAGCSGQGVEPAFHQGPVRLGVVHAYQYIFNSVFVLIGYGCHRDEGCPFEPRQGDLPEQSAAVAGARMDQGVKEAPMIAKPSKARAAAWNGMSGWSQRKRTNVGTGSTWGDTGGPSHKPAA